MNLTLQWIVSGAILLWAAWFLLSRLGLFALVMGKENKAGMHCSTCDQCGPASKMQSMLSKLDSSTKGKI